MVMFLLGKRWLWQEEETSGNIAIQENIMIQTETHSSLGIGKGGPSPSVDP